MGLVYAAEIVLRDVVRMRTQELVSTRRTSHCTTGTRQDS